jgi:hypothetical protein
MLQAGRSQITFTGRSLAFLFNWPKLSTRSVGLALARPLTEVWLLVFSSEFGTSNLNIVLTPFTDDRMSSSNFFPLPFA